MFISLLLFKRTSELNKLSNNLVKNRQILTNEKVIIQYNVKILKAKIDKNYTLVMLISFTKI